MNFIKDYWVDTLIFLIVVLSTAFFAGDKTILGNHTERILLLGFLGTIFAILGRTKSGQKSQESGFLKNKIGLNWRYLIPVFLGLFIGYMLNLVK